MAKPKKSTRIWVCSQPLSLCQFILNTLVYTNSMNFLREKYHPYPYWPNLENPQALGYAHNPYYRANYSEHLKGQKRGQKIMHY